MTRSRFRLLLGVTSLVSMTSTVSSAKDEFNATPYHSGLPPAPASCAPVPENLEEHYRVAIRYIVSQDVQHVLLLWDRPHCPDAAIARKMLQNSELKSRVATAPQDLVKAAWDHKPGEAVAVLAQSERPLRQTLNSNEAALWRDVFWYVPELGKSMTRDLQKLDHQNIKIITTKTLNSSWVNEMRGRGSKDSVSYRIHSVHDTVSDLTNSSSQSHEMSGVESTAVLRFVPPRQPEHNLHINVLRTSPWIVLGTLHREEAIFQPAGAIFVLRSRIERLLADTGRNCDPCWSAEMSCTDPLSGAVTGRTVTEKTMPAMVATQGSGPVKLYLRCGLQMVLRCSIYADREECKELGARSGPSRHRRSAYDDWVPFNGYTSDASTTPQAQVRGYQAVSSERADVSPSSYQQNRVNEPAAYQPDPHQSHYSSRSDFHPSNHQQYHGHQQPNYNANDLSLPSYPHQPGYDREARRTGYYPQHPQHLQHSQGTSFGDRFLQTSRLLLGPKPSKLSLAVFPSFVSCGGSITGCGICVILLEALSTTTPTSCIGPCSLGTSGACAGAIGTLWKELKAQESRRRSSRRYYRH